MNISIVRYQAYPGVSANTLMLVIYPKHAVVPYTTATMVTTDKNKRVKRLSSLQMNIYAIDINLYTFEKYQTNTK